MTQNIRYALRTLAKQPAFVAILIIALALGFGANTAVFSVLNAVLLRPLPFKEPEKIVALAPYDMRIGADNVNDKSTCSYPDFLDWRAQNRVFERVAVYTHQNLTLTDGKETTHMTLGAHYAQIRALIFGHGFRLLVIGCGIGLLGAVFAAIALRRVLFEVNPAEPGTYLLVSAVLFLATFIACWLPAARACRTDPIAVLRNE